MTEGTVEIKKVVYGGLGLTHHDDRTLFIPYTAPGDKVRFEIVSKKKKVLFGRAVEIVEGSPSRIEPSCPIFGTCGGCHFLHIGYEDELELKKSAVMESLERIGGITRDIDSVIPSPERSAYRNHSIFRSDGEGRCGFTMRESNTVVPFPPEGCLLLPEAMRSAIREIPPDSIKPGKEIRARIDRYGAVYFWGLRGSVTPPDVLMEAGGYNFPIDPGSFFQVNTLLNSELISLVLSLPRKSPSSMIDLYSGCGFFSLPFSKISTKVTGIERDPGSYKSSLAAKRLNKVDNVSFIKGNAEREIFRQGEAGLILADPPRSGMPQSAISGILRLKPEEIIIVSCEPPTFSRDAAKFIQAGYSLSRLHIVDLFPSTYHTEIAGLFTRN